MKVICIDDNIEYIGTIPPPQPYFGEIDTVISEGYEYELKEYYCLERFGCCVGFSKYHFAPLSDIDETELVNEKLLTEKA